MTGDKQQRYQFSVIRERMRAHPGPVLNFALGELRLGLPDAIAERLADGVSLATRRSSPDEERAFGAQVVTYLGGEYDIEVDPEGVLAVPGGRAAMAALVACLLEPGDGVLVTEPGYPAFARVAAHRHCRVLSARLDPERVFLPNLDELARSDFASLRLISLNYPNNPTGAVLEAETLATVTAGVGEEVILFNDATYGPLVYGRAPTSLLTADLRAGAGQAVVELHSLSKIFALGPLAISFLVGSESIMERLRRYSDFAWSPLSALHLRIATECLQESDYLHEVRRHFEERLARLRQTLIRLGFEPYATAGGMYILTATPTAIGEQTVESAQEAADCLLDRFGLAVAAWDLPPHRYLRFTSLYEPQDLAGLTALEGSLRVS